MGDKGVLQFTLGLTTGGFLTSLAGADAKLKGFIGGLLGFGAITAGVMKQIEKGAGLAALSKQTGETAGTIYKLQQGLKAVGLDAESSGTLLFQLKKSLGGINENGESTAFVFGQMGLRIDELKKMDAPAAMEAIAQKLAKFDSASATGAASKIFGRYSAREFLQLARSSEDFSEALRRGSVQAAMFDRYAESFHKIEVGMTFLKEKFNSIFLGLAVGIGPALENIIKALNSIDLSEIGRDIGTLMTALTQSFREGRFSELIANAFRVGFDAVLAMAPAVFETLGAFLLRALTKPIAYFQATMDAAMQGFFAGIAKIPGLRDKLGISKDFKPETWDELVTKRMGDIPTMAAEAEADSAARMAEALAKLKPELAKFWMDVTGFASRAPKASGGAAAGSQAQTLGAVYQVQRVALEKMGFVMRGGSANDPAMQTAKNTGKLVNLMGRLVAKTGGGMIGTGEPLNAIR